MHTVSQLSISHSSAMQLTQAAEAFAKKKGLTIAACVVDMHGRVKSLVVMDNAPLIADELVVKKARTALVGMSSADFAEAIAPLPAMEKSMLDLQHITLLGGGFPIFNQQQLIGAIAVGGATVDMDIACAEAALQAVKEQ